MEFPGNDERQNHDSQNDGLTQESRDALHDERSTEETNQRNNPGAVSDQLSENVSDGQNPDEIRDLHERIRELEMENRRYADTCRALTDENRNLQEENAQKDEEKVQIERELGEERRKNAVMEEQEREQRQHKVPVLQDSKKQEEFRIYKLNCAENDYPYYVIHRQKGTMSEGVRNLRDKHPPSRLEASIEVPNSKNAYNHITEQCGIIRKGNLFNYVGDFEELLQKIDDLFWVTYRKILTRH